MEKKQSRKQEKVIENGSSIKLERERERERERAYNNKLEEVGLFWRKRSTHLSGGRD